MGDEPSDAELREALGNVRSMGSGSKEGAVDCPRCGGAARLWFGVDKGDGALSICCVNYDDCGLAYQWPLNEWKKRRRRHRRKRPGHRGGTKNKKA